MQTEKFLFASTSICCTVTIRERERKEEKFWKFLKSLITSFPFPFPVPAISFRWSPSAARERVLRQEKNAPSPNPFDSVELENFSLTGDRVSFYLWHFPHMWLEMPESAVEESWRSVGRHCSACRMHVLLTVQRRTAVQHSPICALRCSRQSALSGLRTAQRSHTHLVSLTHLTTVFGQTLGSQNR